MRHGTGKKVPDYWEASKKLLNDATKFLENLLSYDKDNISEAIIKKIELYINREDFTPDAVSKVSKACTSICMWVRAMYLYHTVALGVSFCPELKVGNWPLFLQLHPCW